MRDPRHRRFTTKSKAPVETPPPTTIPDAEIPVLKEKEEEKKGVGAPWYSGSGAGAGELVGGQGVARVGSSMASRGFLARIAAGLSNALGGSGTFLGGLFASSAGQWLVLGGLAAWGALMLAAAGKVMGGWGAAGTAAPGAPSLSAVGPSGIVIGAPKDRSLGYLAGANKGEILWDAAKAAPKEKVNDAAAPAEEKPAEPKKDEPPPFQMPDVSQVMGNNGGLNRDGFVKKMTSDVSSLHAGGAGTAPQIKDASGFALKKTFDPKGSTRSSLGGMSRARRALSASRLQKTQGRASRAMGQAKLANNMSLGGKNADTDSAAKTFAADAFDQGKSIGGNLTGVGGDGMVVPPGTGAPDGVTNNGIPDVGPGVNQTPYQNQVDSAKNAGDQSAALKTLGMMMLAIGAMLCALGMALMGNHTTFPIGYMLLGAGMALIAMGMMMLMMSANQAKAAKGQGDNINKQYGQQDQGQIVDQCADQANQNGTKTDNCKAQSPQVNGRNTVHQDVQTESNQGYTIDPGNK